MINIIVALPCEAKGLREALRLKGVPAPAGMSAYQNSEYTLVVGGIGKAAAAAAVVAAAQLNGEQSAIGWLNVGVAGHAGLPIGNGYWISRVTDDATGQSWYPPAIWSLSLDRWTLRTVALPQRQAEGEELFDMEAAAFMEIATRFSSSELVHSYKVVSDNLAASLKSVDAKRVERFMVQQVDAMMELLEVLQRTGRWWREEQMLAVPSLFEHYRFSRSQRNRLQGLVRRWQALCDPASLRAEWFDGCRTTTQVLDRFEEFLSGLPVQL